MTDTKLLNYITEDVTHPIKASLQFWIAQSPQFKIFAYNYRDKIRKKIRNAKTHDFLYDVQFEVAVAYFFLSAKPSHFQVEYEKYGTDTRSPDFTVAWASPISTECTEFNIEVKRLREVERVTRFEGILDEIVTEIKKVPSSLGFSFCYDTMESPDLQEKPNFIDRLEVHKESIIKYLTTLIEQENNRLPIDTHKEFTIPFLHTPEFRIELDKPPRKADTNYTSYYGSSLPVLYTQKEFLKFGSTIIKEKLGQMLPGKINFLTILSDSSVYDPSDLSTALSSIALKIRQRDESFFVDKGLDGIQDFLIQVKKLSGILFKSTWGSQNETEHWLWFNTQADCQLSKEIEPYLEQVARRRDTGLFKS